MSDTVKRSIISFRHAMERNEKMETIEQIYASDVYRPFVRFCQLNGLRDMQQLDSRVLARAASWPGMNAQLLARVKLVYTTYRKKNPPAVPPTSTPAATPRLEEQVRAYFAQNAHKLIHISDLMREVGGGLKRADMAKMLARTDWCRQVDGSTYFYQP